MSINLFKESSAVAKVLGDELRGILGELDPAIAKPLLDRLLVDAHATPLLVFTGLYSSGKSTLIKALTDGAASVVIGSGVTTDDVEEFDWDGDVRLVDTPGVHAGRPRHDALAEEALQSADLVLFAVTVELFDDVLTAHLRDVLGRLGKSRQTLIAVTKAGTMDASPGVRQELITRAVGPSAQIPWVECDAQYYLDGLELAGSDPEASKAYVDASGMAKVVKLINLFASQQGEFGRLSQPLQLIKSLTLEASPALTDDPEEQAALTVLARQRSALSRKQIHLDTLLGARAAQFRADAIRAATRFVDGIEGDEENSSEGSGALEVLIAALNDDLRIALDRFRDAVRQLLAVQFDDLASEVLLIEASPHGRVSIQLGEPNSFDEQEVEVRPGYAQVRPGSSPRLTPPAWAGDLSTHLEHFRTFWGAGDGVKASAGSNGHELVLKVGHFFGKKFRPYEAVKAADKVGKAANMAGQVAKVGGVVIPIAIEAYAVFADERAAVAAERARAERRRSITQEVLGEADSITTDALSKVNSALHDTFRQEFERIDDLADEIHGAHAARSELRNRLSSVRQRADVALATLASGDVEDDTRGPVLS